MALSDKIKKKLDAIGYVPSEIEEDAIKTVVEHIENTNSLQTWVTPEIALNMREIIKQARRNYLGVFSDSSNDFTGNPKVWHHLTQSFVESEVKNTDVDPKDITVEAQHPSQNGISSILRSFVQGWMRETVFGEEIDDDIRARAIDGHVIRKVVDKWDNREKKNILKTRWVDPLRFFIDGNADSLHNMPMAEMAILSMPEIMKSYGKKWINLKYLVGKNEVNETRFGTGIRKTTVPMSEIFEYHADIPEWWIHGSKDKWEKDGEPYTLGIVIVSNVFDSPVVHKIMRNKRGIKPYEESRLIKVANRYFGMGRPEQLFGYQLYFNLLYNTRRVNQLLSSNQLFQFRKGTGITPAMISQLYTGGAIPVEEMGDVARLDTRNYSFNDSINEEKQLVDSAQRLTDQNDIALGGSAPASQTATVGVLQERSQGRGSTLKKESFGRYLENLFNRHIVPVIRKDIKKDAIVRMTGDVSEISKYDEAIITWHVNNQYLKEVETGKFILPEQRTAEIERLLQQARSLGKNRWTKIQNDYLNTDSVKVVVNVSNEHEDRQLMLNTLTSLLFNYAPANPNVDGDSLMAMILDKLQINPDLVLKPSKANQQIPQLVGGQPSNSRVPSPVSGRQRPISPNASSLVSQASQLAQ